MSVIGNEFNILEHWNVPKLPDDEGEIRSQELECEETIPFLIAEYSYSLESVRDKVSGIPTERIAKYLDNNEDIRQDLIPSTTKELRQRRLASQKLNSPRTIVDLVIIHYST